MSSKNCKKIVYAQFSNKGVNKMAKRRKHTGALSAVLIIAAMIIGIIIGIMIGKNMGSDATVQPSESEKQTIENPIVDETEAITESPSETVSESVPETESTPIVGELEIGEVVLRVDDNVVTMDEMNYYLYSVRDYYVTLYGEEPWGQTMDDGRTVAEQAKEQLLKDRVEAMLLVNHASEYGVELSAEMKAEYADSAHAYIAGLGADICEQFGLKASAVAGVYSDNEICNQVHILIDEQLRSEIKEQNTDITDEALEQAVMDAYNDLLDQWKSEAVIETTEIWDSIVVGSVG